MSDRQKFRGDIVIACEVEADDDAQAEQALASIAEGLVGQYGAPRGWSGPNGWTTVLTAIPQEVSEV